MIDSTKIILVFFALFLSTVFGVGAVALADETGYLLTSYAIWYGVGVLSCFAALAAFVSHKKKKQVSRRLAK
ncbi:MAG: hypothetical protein HGB00_04695 [Chlorobiaceae bacterium]|nr:hypothetical protein [Chlorobiaceae bacterium]